MHYLRTPLQDEEADMAKSAKNGPEGATENSTDKISNLRGFFFFLSFISFYLGKLWRKLITHDHCKTLKFKLGKCCHEINFLSIYVVWICVACVNLRLFFIPINIYIYIIYIYVYMIYIYIVLCVCVCVCVCVLRWLVV